MTAHTQALPASVPATVEAKCFYFTSLLYDLHKNEKFKRTDEGVLTPLVSGLQGQSADGKERVIYTVSFEIDPEFITSTSPMWANVIPFANATIPSRYL